MMYGDIPARRRCAWSEIESILALGISYKALAIYRCGAAEWQAVGRLPRSYHYKYHQRGVDALVALLRGCINKISHFVDKTKSSEHSANSGQVDGTFARFVVHSYASPTMRLQFRTKVTRSGTTELTTSSSHPFTTGERYPHNGWRLLPRGWSSRFSTDLPAVVLLSLEAV
jgi:hypothetical protein